MTIEEITQVVIKIDAEMREKLRADGYSEEKINELMQGAWDGFGAAMYNGRMA